jgi:hypothetical protein
MVILSIRNHSLLLLPLASPQWSFCQFMTPVAYYCCHWQVHSGHPVNSWPQLLIMVATGKPTVVILSIHDHSLLLLPLASPQWSSCQFVTPVAYYGCHWQAHSGHPVNSWLQLLIMVATGKPTVVILSIREHSLLLLPLASPQWSSCQFVTQVYYCCHWQAHSQHPANSWPQLLIIVATGKPTLSQHQHGWTHCKLHTKIVPLSLILRAVEHKKHSSKSR